MLQSVFCYLLETTEGLMGWRINRNGIQNLSLVTSFQKALEQLKYAPALLKFIFFHSMFCILKTFQREAQYFILGLRDHPEMIP